MGEAMNRRGILEWAFIFVATTAVFLLPSLGPQVHAQQGCVDLRAIGQGANPTNHPINPETDSWGGDVWGTLGSEFRAGYFSGNDGDIIGHGTKGISNSARNGHYVFFFGDDSFTFEVTQATFNFPPGKAGIGQYKGHGNILAGTGRFQYVSGSMDWEAPFIAWSLADGSFTARGNFTITATICGISAQ
jgi:hypothetical protein